MSDFESCAIALIDAGKQLYQHGMVPATSGNFSARLNSGNLAITVSGKHKGKLTEHDIMQITANGESLDGRRSSAETLLHVYIYKRYPNARFILHPHSVNATVLSNLCGDQLALQDYELLKAFPGVNTHESCINIPIFDNDQNIDRLAKKVDDFLATSENLPGYLIRGHGFYTWGETIEDTLRHVEAFEFLFDCELRMRAFNNQN